MQALSLTSTVLIDEILTGWGNERMLAMPEINYIKHLRENEDLSLSEIARKTGKDWRTVKSMQMETFPQVKLDIEKVE